MPLIRLAFVMRHMVAMWTTAPATAATRADRHLRGAPQMCRACNVSCMSAVVRRRARCRCMPADADAAAAHAYRQGRAEPGTQHARTS